MRMFDFASSLAHLPMMLEAFSLSSSFYSSIAICKIPMGDMNQSGLKYSS